MDELEFDIGPTDTGQQRSVRAPRGPRLRRPPRALTVGLIAACVVLVTTGLALASVPNLSGRVNVLLHGTPTATPRIPPGGNLLYVENATTWGQLSLNGKPVALDDLASVDGIIPTAIYLPRGAITIEYRADPFPLLRCRLSVPASKTDTCPLDASYIFPSVPAGLQQYSPRALNLTPTLDKLPSAARASLQQVIGPYVAVQKASVVQPGERYVDASRQIVYADQPLTATFTQALATAASPTSQGCAVVCMPPLEPNPYGEAPSAAAPVADFVVDAHLAQSFSYATASGQPVSTNAPIAASSAVHNDNLVPLTVTWDGSWHLALNGIPQPNSVACAAGAQALQPYLFDPRGDFQVLYIAGETPAPNVADGCVFRISGVPASAYVGVLPPGNYFHLFYRFGMVLAINDLADAAWVSGDDLLSGLPFTDDAETALAQQIDPPQPYS